MRTSRDVSGPKKRSGREPASRRPWPSSAVVDEAVAMLAATLDVEYCDVLELLPDGEALVLRAGVGWGEDLVRNATVGLDSQAGYALRSERPVLVEDLSAETRFDVLPLM